jgi:2-keto-4-pentenoate hydratase
MSDPSPGQAELDVAALATILERATLTGSAVGKLTDRYPLDVSAAYRVQRENIARRVTRGERIVGVKMGFTSKVKMIQMGVDDVIWGVLTDTMEAGADPCDLSGLIHPKVEPEIVYRLGRRVSGADDDIESAVDAVAVGIEVLDSRFEGYKFTLPDVIADNASAAGFRIGPWHPMSAAPGTPSTPASSPAPDISNLPVTMAVNGQTVRTGSTAAILGDPWESLRSAARLAAQDGIVLEEGWIVLAGGITEAVPLTPGAVVTVSAAGLDTVEFRSRCG